MLKAVRGYSDNELYALSHLAYTYFLHGKNKQAKVIFEGLVALDPYNDYYFRALGAISFRERSLRRAVLYFGRATKLRPDLPEGFVNRAEVYIFMNKLAEARRDLQSAICQMGDQHSVMSKKVFSMLKDITQKLDISN